MKNVKTYKTDDAVLIVAKKNNLARTEIFLSILVPANHTASLYGLKTNVYDKQGNEVAEFKVPVNINNMDDKSYLKYTFETTYTYGYEPLDLYIKKDQIYEKFPFPTQDHWQYFDNFLIGTNHKVTIKTPKSSIITDTIN